MRRKCNGSKMHKSSAKKVRVIPLKNEIHSNDSEVIAVRKQFQRSMRIDAQKRSEMNAPIAKYDIVKRLAYLEYPDGRIVYANET